MATTPSAFLETIIALLLPHLAANASDLNGARQDVLGLLRSYATRTRAECLLAAQIIALGMATLDALADSRSTGISDSMRLRHRGNANNLSRATLRTAKALDDSLAQPIPQMPVVPAKDPPAPAADPQPLDDRNKRIWAAAMVDNLRHPGLPVDLLTAKPPLQTQSAIAENVNHASKTRPA